MEKEFKHWEWTIVSKNNHLKKLELINGNMCDLEECDIAVCSSFVKDYYPLKGTLIGALKYSKNISVEDLSVNPEINLQMMGAWLSKETNTSFHRVACLEMIDLENYLEMQLKANLYVNRSFSTLKYLLEQANLLDIPTNTIATTILGTGLQNIELQYVLGTMIAVFKEVLENNDNVQNIKIYEMDINKANIAAKAIDEAINVSKKADVFISYSSKQAEQANIILNFLKENNISCWMAPYSIPSGSNYLDEIPAAISQIKVMLLLLTPESSESRWVQKEISSAIGANKLLLPYQLYNFTLSQRLMFLLDGEQIFSGNNISDDDLYSLLKHLKDNGC